MRSRIVSFSKCVATSFTGRRATETPLFRGGQRARSRSVS
jgi:hypothetical protein